MKCDNCPWPEITECYGINMPEYNFEKNELEKIIKEAFKSFEKEDYYLVVHKINEVAIVAGFYFHIRQLVQKYYPELNVDIEYDKNGDSRKRYGNEHYARPDLIIHKRRCNKYNILYMEFKKIDNDRRIIDYKKLEEFTKKTSDREDAYQYRYGMFIEIEENGFDIIWYIDGEQNGHLKLNRNQ